MMLTINFCQGILFYPINSLFYFIITVNARDNQQLTLQSSSQAGQIIFPKYSFSSLLIMKSITWSLNEQISLLSNILITKP